MTATVKAIDDLGPGSLIGRPHLVGIAAYLVLSALAAMVIAGEMAPIWVRVGLALALMAAFLILTRMIVRRMAGLDEFQCLLAWRALAAAGFIAVWFELFMATMFLAAGRDNLFVLIALGPPEFWLCAALFLRSAERHYAAPR